MTVSKVPRSQLVKLFGRRLQSGNKRVGREIAAYLLSTGRTAELDSLLRDLLAYNLQQGLVEVTAVTAHPLTGSARQDVIKQVQALYPQAQTVTVNNRIDHAVLAGVSLELPGRQLDLSARAKLNKLKQLTGKDV